MCRHRKQSPNRATNGIFPQILTRKVKRSDLFNGSPRRNGIAGPKNGREPLQPTRDPYRTPLLMEHANWSLQQYERGRRCD